MGHNSSDDEKQRGKRDGQRRRRSRSRSKSRSKSRGSSDDERKGGKDHRQRPSRPAYENDLASQTQRMSLRNEDAPRREGYGGSQTTTYQQETYSSGGYGSKHNDDRPTHSNVGGQNRYDNQPSGNGYGQRDDDRIGTGYGQTQGTSQTGRDGYSHKTSGSGGGHGGQGSGYQQQGGYGSNTESTCQQGLNLQNQGNAYGNVHGSTNITSIPAIGITSIPAIGGSGIKILSQTNSTTSHSTSTSSTSSATTTSYGVVQPIVPGYPSNPAGYPSQSSSIGNALPGYSGGGIRIESQPISFGKGGSTASNASIPYGGMAGAQPPNTYGNQHQSGYGQSGQQQSIGGSQQSGYGQQAYGNQHPAQTGYGAQQQSTTANNNYGPPLEFVGPFLRFTDIDTARQVWSGSVLIVTRRRPDVPPTCTYTDHLSLNTKAKARELTTYGENVFYRFTLDVPLTNDGRDKAVTYQVNGGSEYTFYVPPVGVDCRVMGISCNGFSSDVTDPNSAGGLTPMWKDVMRRHKEKPFHVMLGGGDQLYMDAIFTSNDEILNWLKIEGREAKSNSPYSQQMQTSVERFCFNNYVSAFGEDVMKDAFATIPYVFQWDDHDIFDGWGSYPDWLAHCPVFHGIFRSARHFYMLFQQHTTDVSGVEDQYGFGFEGSFNYLKHLGPSVAVLGVDTRSERTPTQVVSRQSWSTIWDNLYRRIRPGVKHLIVQVAIPIVWPRLVAADAAVTGLGTFLAFAEGKLSAFSKLPTPPLVGGIGEAIGKTGLYKSVMGCFGEPELADDLYDHWTHKNHEPERKDFVLALQSFAQQKNIRVTFLSGDVHCTGVGWFRSKEQAQDPRQDPRVMYQIVSSAIVNVPPPAIVIGMLHRNAGPYDLDGTTVDELLPTFTEDVNGNPLDAAGNKVLARRNWCSVEVAGNDLAWNIYAEREDRSTDAKVYPVLVPALGFSAR
ncbi:hypothetical protein DFS34DRAFT_612673 [Phlyctochytrium arcticum]|nr:hypothetical protein DFS34DRAFT_612673 [Phlyctochytrium arcticum]